jgi:tRNA threonylcarbamoyladenosine biosynthesis protein TsaB
MRVLALDTTTRAGSVALVEDDQVIEARCGDPTRTHAERLPGEILALADRHHVAMSDVDVFAVASGPGSFTGLRIGIATIQGLAFATNRPVVTVSALEALAHAVSADRAPGALVAAWIDAHRHEVFAALYRVASARPFTPERLNELEGPTVSDPVATLDRWSRQVVGAATWFVGDGAVLYSQTILSGQASDRYVLPTPLLAGTIGCIASVRARAGDTISPSAVQPLYVRRPDAEIGRDRVGR